jgi:hypothetical protein
MALSVTAIKFNHDTSAATSDALNIRVDAAGFVKVPEWVGGETLASESPAAYAIGAVGKNTITVQARFKTDRLSKFTEVRAVFIARVGVPKGPLGDLAPAQVIFDASGNSGFVSFQCTSGLGSTVRVRNIQWQWQFRTTPSGAWKTFATTLHRIYVLLAPPTAPWQQAPYLSSNLQLPWTDVLDVACAWASGASTRDAAAGLIADHVHALGPGTITYDCPGGGATHYASGNMFNCTAFLSRLGGGFGNGLYVNCTDCATITSTFSNILGCDLWQSRMGSSFALNEILGIGSAVWQTACGWGSFSYHEVAWKNQCIQSDALFDACLQVDGDANPTGGAPHVGVLPKNMVFGAVNAGLYRDRLCTPAGRPNCNPQPATRIRRPVF